MPDAPHPMPDLPDLSPTLWRTCRALANRHRLQILKLLFQQRSQTVSAVADALDLSVSAASQYLRLLNSRGLIQANRLGRFVVYCAVPNEAISGTPEILRDVKATFARSREPVTLVFRLATAFTHPRRIRIVNALDGNSMSFLDLKQRTRISAQALERHLPKLEAREMIEADQTGATPIYRLGHPRNKLGRTLLQLARHG